MTCMKSHNQFVQNISTLTKNFDIWWSCTQKSWFVVFCPNFLFDWHFHIMKSVVRSDDIKVPTTILWFLQIVPIWWHSTNKINKKNQHKICIKSDYYSNDDRNISKNISNIECLPGTIYELLLRAKYKIYKIKANNNNENWSKPREKVCLIGKN